MLVDTNPHKLQPSLNEKVVAEGHCCHTTLHVGVKAKTKTKFLRCTGYLNSITYNASFIANSSSCTITERSKLLALCLTAVKNMLLSTVKRYTRDRVKVYFGLLQI